MMLWPVIVLLLLTRVRAKLVGAAVLPHGDVALDPSFLTGAARQAGEKIAHGARQAAQWFVRDDKPEAFDTVFLSTPHGIQLTNDFGVYLGKAAAGSINITGDVKNHSSYTLNMPPIALDDALSSDLVVDLTSTHSNANVSGVATSADGSHPMPLEWAEIIPLMLMPESKRHKYQYIILSYPFRRYTDAPAMVSELLQLGRFIRNWLDYGLPKNRKIAVLISGDMSHTHQASGPYGYSSASALFDKAIGHWASNPCRHASSLLEEGRALQQEAKSCGFTGMVLLHGMLCGSHKSEFEDGHVWVNQNATYYGMMAATFDPIQQQNIEIMTG